MTDINVLLSATPAQMTELSHGELMELKLYADGLARAASKYLAVLQTEFERRYVAGINKLGTSHLEFGDVSVTVNIPKRVKWEQSKLSQSCDALANMGEDPYDYIETEIKVSETKYNAWTPKVQALFEPARTVEHGKAKVEFSLAERKAA